MGPEAIRRALAASLQIEPVRSAEKSHEKFMCSLGYGLFVGMRFGCQVVNVSEVARIVGYNERIHATLLCTLNGSFVAEG